jgi:hypothetical protein
MTNSEQTGVADDVAAARGRIPRHVLAAPLAVAFPLAAYEHLTPHGGSVMEKVVAYGADLFPNPIVYALTPFTDNPIARILLLILLNIGVVWGAKILLPRRLRLAQVLVVAAIWLAASWATLGAVIWLVFSLPN